MKFFTKIIQRFLLILLPIALFSFDLRAEDSEAEIDLNERLKKLETEVQALSEYKKKEESKNLNNPVASVLKNAVIGGLLQVDGKWYNQKNSGDKNDGVDIRRARLSISGDIDKDFYYRFQNEFAANGSAVADAFISYLGFKNTELKVGHFKPSYSLEKIIGIPNVTFVNRSIITDSTPARLVGFQIARFGQDWQAALGVFGEGFGNQNRADDSGYSVSSRLTFAPINNQHNLLHIGASGSYYSKDRRKLTTSTNDLTVDPIDHESYLNFEFAGKLSSVYLQGEYMFNQVNYDNDTTGSNVTSTTGNKADFQGYYLQTSWFITDDYKEYRVKTGDFGIVKVKNSFDSGGIGAWEIAGRISRLDKNNQNLVLGKTDEVTMALNWYPNSYLRLMINYQKFRTDMITYNQNYDVFLVRSQVSF